MEGMVALFIPIAVCVILPIAIVWLSVSKTRNYDNKRAEIILKAIECQPNIDPEAITAALKQTDSTAKRKTPVELLNQRLLSGCICTLVGIALMIYGYLEWHTAYLVAAILLPVGVAYLIVYLVTRKQVLADAAKEKAAEVETADVTIIEQ